MPETPRLPGDADKNGTVNALDAAILADNWLASNANWAMGDFNDDGVVNDIDATMMAANWLKTQTAAASVPEPSVVVMLLCAAVALFVLRRGDS